MRMKKSIFCSVFALACIVGGFFARTNVQAQAQAEPDVLLVPNSYQQYLELESPVDIAMSTRYMAIADHNNIYLYDTADELYRTYTHEYNVGNPLSNNISKLQFDD